MHENNYHHEEVVEIMVSPPGWGLKWGNIIIGFIVLMIFGFAYLFSYPDTLRLPIDLSATASVITVRPPAVNYGIETFLVKNGATVKQGEPLLVWYDEHQSSFAEINKLEKILLGYTATEPAENLKTSLKTISATKLGALEVDYDTLIGPDPKPSEAIIKQVLAAITQWKTQWVSMATVTGTVTLNTLVPQIKTPVDKQKPVLYLQPLNAHYTAHGLINNKRYSGIKPGQEAYVSINELSGKKVPGTVIGVSPIANQNMHDVYIQLDQAPGLNLTFTGDATIILHSRTLLQRLFNINN